jgi:hypothetical protein
LLNCTFQLYVLLNFEHVPHLMAGNVELDPLDAFVAKHHERFGLPVIGSDNAGICINVERREGLAHVQRREERINPEALAQVLVGLLRTPMHAGTR